MSVNSAFSNLNSVIAHAMDFLNAITQHGNPHLSDHYEHDEIHQSFNLTHGDRIEVSRISGPVEVESTESAEDDVAEVHIIRSAKIKADLAWRKLGIEQTPTGLIIEPEAGPPCPRDVRVNHYVLLKLPRQTSFTAVGVSGTITIAAIDGAVQITGCSGSVIMKETNGPVEILSVSGSVILHVTRLSERGLRVSGSSGTVELYLPDELDAELSIADLSGQLLIDIPQQELQPSSYHYRLGRGGPRISVSGVSGNVVLRRAEGPGAPGRKEEL
jgi:hypothetical protein